MLLDAGAAELGELAAECVRIERGRPRYGIDIDDSVIPQEAGLNERAVSFTKGCYVGQETVARLFYRGKPNRHLRGLRSSEPISAGTVLTHAGRRGRQGDQLGQLTAPRPDRARAGQARGGGWHGRRGGRRGAAEIVALPFAG